MAKQNKPGYQCAKSEGRTFALFYLGQNLIWGFFGVLGTFLTDIGISAATAAAILIIPKLWDAVNDVLFGYIVDRYKFKSGLKFMPWVKIGTSAVGVSLIALFAIPASAGNTVKIVWFIIAYLCFDAAYTILDTPSFALTTVMTSNVTERTEIIAGNKLWSMVGGVLAVVLIPMIRPKFGWTWSCVAFVVISVIMMIPMMFTVKERHTVTEEKKEDPTFKEMLNYLKNNKYLIVALIAMLLLGTASVEQAMSIRIARICFGKESAGTIISAGAAVAVIVVSAIIPPLSKKFDKFDILCVGCAFAVVMDIVSYFVGYSNFVLAIIFIMLKCTGLGFWQVIIYMLIADTVEYGTYKSGTRAAGITFSLQCFVAKLKNTLIDEVILIVLAMIGFVEGENVVQSTQVTQGVWGLFTLVPAIGFVLALIVLKLFYKLRAKDVQTMAQYNNGEISKEEAEKLLAEKYGPAAEM